MRGCGIRAGALRLAERCALAFLRADRQTIVFGGSRHAVELMLTRLRDALQEGRGPVSRVRGYRSGYLPTERRAIERGLRSGEVLGVVSTNALELGLDIGRLDAAVLAGYPGSIAATWQRIGRAGRRLEPSAAILVATSHPVDQYVAAHPDLLFESSPEEARLDPENLHILLGHLRAATFELPFEPGERFGLNPADDLLAFLGEEGHVRQAADGRWYWASENFPASEVSLRSGADVNVVIIDTGPDRPRVIGEVDLFSARTLVHEGAIYLHESRQYHVDRLDWDEQKAYVRPVDVDYYTQAELSVTLKPLERFDAEDAVGGERAHGEVMVSSIATIYKKLRLETLENLGWGRIFLPEIELHTTAYWLALEPEAVADWRRDELDLALVGAGRAMQTVASILLMSDPRDLGLVSQVRSPHAERPIIYLYDGVPGGVGLAARLFQRHEELVGASRDLVAVLWLRDRLPGRAPARAWRPAAMPGRSALRLLTTLLPPRRVAARSRRSRCRHARRLAPVPGTCPSPDAGRPDRRGRGRPRDRLIVTTELARRGADRGARDDRRWPARPPPGTPARPRSPAGPGRGPAAAAAAAVVRRPHRAGRAAGAGASADASSRCRPGRSWSSSVGRRCRSTSSRCAGSPIPSIPPDR